jgi:hypothetical protein
LQAVRICHSLAPGAPGACAQLQNQERQHAVH